MPYYHFYDETGEFDVEDSEKIGPAPAGGFHYEEATSKQFDPQKLEGVATVALELIRGAGVAEMRIRYDGGSDEGFAHADDVWINGDRKSLEEISDQLATPANIQTIRNAVAIPDGSNWHNAGEFYRKLVPDKVVGHALDELAHEIASLLLGQGYGTGEYELYGALTVNFETGEMMDDPGAGPP